MKKIITKKLYLNKVRISTFSGGVGNQTNGITCIARTKTFISRTCLCPGTVSDDDDIIVPPGGTRTTGSGISGTTP